MTTEQKAKRYDEAIERAESIYNETAIPSATTKGICTYIFPELKESEDERIRKGLIENFKWFCGDFPETTKWGKDDNLLVKDIIAWLEKQDKIVAYYEDRLDECACKYFNKGYKHALEKQGVQKEINLVEILKHYPKETELYSPLYGRLWLAEVDEKNKIITCYKHHLEEGCTRAILEQEDTVSFYSNGTTGLPDFKVSKDCMLFLYNIEKQNEQKPVNKVEISDEYKGLTDFEKACEFLNSSSILRNTNIVEKFKNYMKGE